MTHLHSLAKTADIECALVWMALMVSLLLPVQMKFSLPPPPPSTVLMDREETEGVGVRVPELSPRALQKTNYLINVYQVWSLTQFYSVEFSQYRISATKCVFNKLTIEVSVSCF